MTFKRIKFLGFIFLLALVFLTGCFNSYTYEDSGTLVTAVLSPAGPDEQINLFERRITIDVDGTLILSAEEEEDTNRPTVEKTLSDSKIDQLKEKIEEEKFKKLEEDVTAPAEDGAYYQITVHFADHTQTAEGWNPSDEQFNALHDYIFNLVDDEVYEDWEEDVREYLSQNE